MKTIFIKLFCLILALIWIIHAKGQVVTKEEATKIAQNWINIVIDRNETWGGNENASIVSVKTLEKDDSKLGYFCHVTPTGFILVSIRKELAPVKLYSETDNFQNDEDDCLPDFLYDIPLKIINTIEGKLTSIENISTDDLKEILEIDYSEAWDQVYNYIPGTYTKKTTGSSGKDDYQEGDFLLTSNWHQKYPYNDDCPVMSPPCSDNGRAVVGCVATAGAQIMNYWDWPPYKENTIADPYDWPNIMDTVTITSSPTKINAVAKLCAEVGEAIDMDYGCDESSAFTHCSLIPPICTPSHDLESKLVSAFHFDPSIVMMRRGDFNLSDWFNEIKSQINASRPIVHSIRIDLLYGGHAVVVDGWQELGPPLVRQYHINFGWGGGNSSRPCWTSVPNSNMWYTLDAIPCFYDDFMHIDIRPVNAIGTSVVGDYHLQPQFPYRYFDLNAAGHNAIFHGGQNLQFFPGIKVTGNSSSENPIRFQGYNLFKLGLFTRGDLSKGVRIHNGEIELTNFGSIKLH